MATTKQEAAMMCVAQTNQLLSELLYHRGRQKVCASWHLGSEADLLDFYIQLDFTAKRQSRSEIVELLHRAGQDCFAMIEKSLRDRGFELTYHQPTLEVVTNKTEDYRQESECSLTVNAIQIKLPVKRYNECIKSLRSELAALKLKPTYTQESICWIKRGWDAPVQEALSVNGKFRQESPNNPNATQAPGYWSLINGIAGFTGEEDHYLAEGTKRQRVRLNILRLLKGTIKYKDQNYSFQFQLLHNHPRVLILDQEGNDQTKRLMADYVADANIRSMSTSKIISSIHQHLVRGAVIVAHGSESEMKYIECSNYAAFNEIILCGYDLRLHITREGVTAMDCYGNYHKEISHKLMQNTELMNRLPELFNSKNRTYALMVIRQMRLLSQYLFGQFYFL